MISKDYDSGMLPAFLSERVGRFEFEPGKQEQPEMKELISIGYKDPERFENTQVQMSAMPRERPVAISDAGDAASLVAMLGHGHGSGGDRMNRISRATP